VGLTLRVDLGAHGSLGPGKVRLLELVDELGSIAEAGRTMGMSYRRAWLLMDSLNRMFLEPVVAAQAGGVRGGGTQLTPLGRRVVRSYRRIEQKAATAARKNLADLSSELAATPPPRRPAADID
jgi:molybdate transport system regulatory protein